MSSSLSASYQPLVASSSSSNASLRSPAVSSSSAPIMPFARPFPQYQPLSSTATTSARHVPSFTVQPPPIPHPRPETVVISSDSSPSSPAPLLSREESALSSLTLALMMFRQMRSQRPTARSSLLAATVVLLLSDACMGLMDCDDDIDDDTPTSIEDDETIKRLIQAKHQQLAEKRALESAVRRVASSPSFQAKRIKHVK